MSTDSIRQYEWGSGCYCFVLVDEAGLSVKRELMPPGSAEQRHLHLLQEQYFFILRGSASFLIDERELSLEQHEGVLVAPGQEHCIRNRGQGMLEFLLITLPNVAGDRLDLPCSL